MMPKTRDEFVVDAQPFRMDFGLLLMRFGSLLFAALR